MAIIFILFALFVLMIVAAILCTLAMPLALVIFILFLCSFGILSTLFWIWMIIDCIQNNRLGSTEKIIWAVVIALTHFIGALVYFFFGKLRTKVFPSTAARAA
jgi:hypothetical protein